MHEIDLTRLTEIFDKQRELLNRFDEVERQNNLLDYDIMPVFIQDPSAEKRLREFAWRYIEELCEARELESAMYLTHVDSPNAEKHMREFRTEVSDAFHFLVGLCLLSDITPGMIMSEYYEFVWPSNDRSCWLEVCTYSIGQAMHELKTRPWKLVQRRSDVHEYRKKLRRAFMCFTWVMFADHGISFSVLYEYYRMKNQINHGRLDAIGAS